jgi:hypothetical protein
MNPKLERFEVEDSALRDDELAVQDRPFRQRSLERLRKLRKVPIERLAVATLDEEFAPVLENERAKAVPLRLEDPTVAVRERGDALRQHRKNGGHDG